MQPKSRKWLEDVLASCEFILDCTKGKSIADYKGDGVLRAAVERHFEIIGEAMGRIARHDEATASRVGDYPHIIAFRNILIHGYDIIEQDEVWNVIEQHLPELRKDVMNILKD